MTQLKSSTLAYPGFLEQLRAEAQKPNAYLVPVRIFLAAGWLRAFAEKLMDPTWLTGQALTAFLTKHLHDGMPFAMYHDLAQRMFVPNAITLANAVMLGQLLVGLALLVGLFTPLALLGGLFMNLNFLMSGAPDPSAFYVVLQLILLAGGAGKVFGLDGFRKSQPTGWHLPIQRQRAQQIRQVSLWCGLGSALLAGVAFTGITHFDPGTSVKDAAAVLCVLAFVGLGLSIISYLRQPEW